MQHKIKADLRSIPLFSYGFETTIM